MLIHVLSFAIGYFSGSILFAWVVTKIAIGRDIKEIGDGNPGVNNVLLNVGRKYGVMVAILDLLKVIIPMLSGKLLGLDDVSIVLIGIGGVLGHLYPVYFKFRGGRGASCTLASYIILAPFELLISAVVVSAVLVSVKKLRARALYLVLPLIITLSMVFSFFFNHSMAVRLGILITPVIALLKKKNIDKMVSYLKEFTLWFEHKG